MKIAILMLTYNRRPYTQQTLEHYERQIGDYKRFDFYILDNGSTDDTVSYLKNYSGSLNMDVTYGKENLGIADGTKYLLKEKCFEKGYEYFKYSAAVTFTKTLSNTYQSGKK